MNAAATSGADIYYEEHGNGPALVLVPGLGGVGSFWKPQVAFFSGRYRVLIHDHRGTGKSAKSLIRYSIEQMAQDVLDVMNAARVDRATLIGHSTGGAVAQYLGARHADRFERLVLSATWAFPDAYLEGLFRTRQEVLRSADFAAYDRLGKLLCYPPWFVSRHPEVLVSTSAGAEPEIILSRIDALLEFDSRKYVKQITAPTLIVAADDDMITPPHLGDALEQLLPRATRVRLRRGGHYCPQTVASEYNAAIEQFLLKETNEEL